MTINVSWEDRMATSTQITIGAAETEGFPAILELLARADLPPEGLLEHIETALVARTGGEIVGSAALEVYDDGALLRSVAVDPNLQGQGLGVRLTEAVLHRARELSITHVYLLTETAAEFFPRFGFQPVERSEVPEGVKQSVEFTTLCPDSALAMGLSLR
jgi:amino-acid N-acetyltransferase